MKKHTALHHEDSTTLMPLGRHLLPKGPGLLLNQTLPLKRMSPPPPTQSPHFNYGAVVFQSQRARLAQVQRVFRQGGSHESQPQPHPYRGATKPTTTRPTTGNQTIPKEPIPGRNRRLQLQVRIILCALIQT